MYTESVEIQYQIHNRYDRGIRDAYSHGLAITSLHNDIYVSLDYSNWTFVAQIDWNIR